MLLFCANCTIELLPMLLGAWMLGGAFWYYFLGQKLRARSDKANAEMQLLQERNFQLEQEKEILKTAHFKLIKDYDALIENPKKVHQPHSPTLDFTENQFDQKVESLHFINGNATPHSDINFDELFIMTDLKIIEGIGPKIESILKEANIHTWKDLSNCSPSKIQKILERTNPNYRVHNPTTWPDQANLANNGQWDELVELQKAMNVGIGETNRILHSKIEKMAIKKLGLALHEYTDLKVVEGIGPKIEQLLKNAGITNWKELANVNIFDLKSILAGAGDRYRLANPESWPQQAALAENGSWKELKKYQNGLK